MIGMAVGALAALALPLTGTASSWAADTPLPSPAGKASEPTQAQWHKVDAVSRSHHALGVFDGDADPVLALPKGTSAAEKAKIEGELPAGTNITVKTSQFTQPTMDKIRDVVTARKWNREAITHSVSVMYDAEKDKLLVQTDAPLASLKALTDAYPGTIETRNARVEPVIDTRFGDNAPFNGGASTITETGGSCTAGFGVKPESGTSARAMITAAHCNTAVGQNVWNRRLDNSAGAWMGSVYQRDRDADVEMLAPGGAAGPFPYNFELWGGGTATSGTDLFVRGDTVASTGTKVCVSGSMTYNHCGHPITSTAFTVCYPGSTCIKNGRGFLFDRGGTNFPYYNNGKFAIPGDSGAPVYVPDSTNSAAWIVGINSGIAYDCCGHPQHMIGVKWRSTAYSVNWELLTDTDH
ncbi:S1 family peptidase [Streptomyces sp. NPDC002623]